MPNPKPPYPPEFRAEAVRLARAPGHTIRRVAHDLGIANESLRRDGPVPPRGEPMSPSLWCGNRQTIGKVSDCPEPILVGDLATDHKSAIEKVGQVGTARFVRDAMTR